jgi:predicted porin
MAASAEATIYGRMHADFANVDNGDNSTLAVTSNASRIGFKGSEDLGDGLKAIWQIESQISSDTRFGGGDDLADRNTFVGLSGGFGTALIGRHDTPYKIVGRKTDFFGDQYGDSRAMTNGLGQDARLNNVVAYATPAMGGFGVLAAYASGNDVDVSGTPVDEGKTDAYSINLTYKSDMFWVGGAYQAGDDTSDVDFSAARVGGYVKLAGFKIAADVTSQELNVAGAKTELDTYGIGASYTIGGKHVIKGQYYDGKVKDAGVEEKASTASLGYDYKLSKKTTAGAFYSQVTNKDMLGANLWNSPADLENDEKDPSAIGVYVKVNF